MRSEPKTEIDSPLLESQELFRFALDVSKMGVWGSAQNLPKIVL
jgi:hypothetical protein